MVKRPALANESQLGEVENFQNANLFGSPVCQSSEPISSRVKKHRDTFTYKYSSHVTLQSILKVQGRASVFLYLPRRPPFTLVGLIGSSQQEITTTAGNVRRALTVGTPMCNEVVKGEGR